MSKINKIKEMLQNVLAQFAKMSTDGGLLQWDGDEELAVGMSVVLVDENGDESPAPDGEYRNEDGTVFVIADGKVVEIREPEVEAEAEPEAEPESEGDQVPSGVTAEAQEPEEEPEPEADPRDEQIANLEAEVARLEEENGALRERIAELEAKLEEPAAEPAAEQFEKTIKSDSDDEKLNNLRRYFKK